MTTTLDDKNMPTKGWWKIFYISYVFTYVTFYNVFVYEYFKQML